MLNKVILMGRLCADPEQKQTPNGIHVATFPIAVDRNYADKDGNRQTDFVNIVAWRSTADFVSKYFAKGRMIAIEGSIQTRNYEDKQGNKRTAFEVVADQVYFADSKPNTEIPTGQNAPVFVPPPNGGSFAIGDFEEVSVDESGLPF